MSSKLHVDGIDEYPSALWVAVPSVLLVSAYFVRKWYLSYRLRVYGIGRGAKGFQTNVRKVRITPEIAARLKRGEEVSPEEIEAASREMDERERLGLSSSSPSSSSSPLSSSRVIIEDEKPFVDERTPREPSPPRGNGKGKASKSKVAEENEWLPESVTKGGSKKRRGRKG